MNQVRVILSVDWEGRELSDQNLEAIKTFRDHFPEAKTLHFLNAAYFTKANINKDLAQKKITSVLRKGDEHGLHIHGWRTLFEKSGVSYKPGPSWVQDKVMSLSKMNQQYEDGIDFGHDVPISAYSVKELRSVIRCSLEIFKRYDFCRPQSFRAGGWMATEDVLKAVQLEGFLFDSSAVPPFLLKDKRKSPILHDWLDQIWPEITETTQPYVILEEGHDKSTQKLWEIPDNGCLADYMTGDEIFWAFKRNWETFKDKKCKDDTINLSIGYHQETASKYIDRVADGLKKIQRFCQREKIEWKIEPLPVGG